MPDSSHVILDRPFIMLRDEQSFDKINFQRSKLCRLSSDLVRLSAVEQTVQWCPLVSVV
jgi:hypothetical protein